METLVLEAEIRKDKGKGPAHRVRREGKIPAVLYGADKGSVPLILSPRQLGNLLRQGGTHAILQLQLHGEELTPVMVVDFQRDPVKGTLLHVDLQRIALDRKMHVSVPVVVTGEPRGVKEQNGVLEVITRELEVECLPLNIPTHLTVDVAALGVGDHLRVADLQQLLGEKIHILREPNAVICHVIMPKIVEEKPAEVEAVAAAPAEPEVIKKGKVAEEEESTESS
ncbi:MAG: 50S ribosomal protein L25 [Acidobacteria bacterium]|nr:50S ribosomal protein L25 [Acidobacteriota bacterium]